MRQGAPTNTGFFALDSKPHRIAPGLTHEGHSTGLAGTDAVAEFAVTDHALAREFIVALWNTPIPPGENRFYDRMLYLMSLMHPGG